MASVFELRIVLIIVSVIIIVAIYIWHRANSKDQVVDSIKLDQLDLTAEADDMPALKEAGDNETLPDDLRLQFQGVSKTLREETLSKRIQEAKQTRQASHNTPANPAADDSKQMLLVFHVIAHQANRFTGPMIKQMMSELGLEYGQMGAYHYNVERFNKKHSVYCIVNMLKPGSFELRTMDQLKTRGLTLILQLPGPEEGLKSFNIMLAHAQRLATFLNGDLLDENHNPVSQQSISSYKEQVQLFGLRATRQTVVA